MVAEGRGVEGKDEDLEEEEEEDDDDREGVALVMARLFAWPLVMMVMIPPSHKVAHPSLP